MKRNLSKTVQLLSLVIALITYTIQTISAQYVMGKTVVDAATINPKLHYSTDKKLIHTSSNLQWSFVKDNISSMESRLPYLDGVAASMNGHFDKNYLMLRGDKHWSEDDVQLGIVSKINWGKYTDNFVILYFGDSLDFGFFNDSKWSNILYNAGMVSKMLKAGQFKGVFIDDENYYENSHGWKYEPAWFPDYSFKQVKDKCRERGKSFMQALQSNFTDPLVVLDFIWFGDHWNNYDTINGRQILWLSFKDGMLEAARAGDMLVEGNEMAYYYQETSMFTDIYNEFRQHKFAKYGANDLQDKYKTQVQIGHGIYPSLYYGIFRWPHTYSDAEHDMWWENQLYNALLTSDKYVWIWTEPDEDWWGDSGLPFTSNFSSISNNVKSKIKNQQSLNWDMVKYNRSNWEGNLVTPEEKWHISNSPTITITSPANKSVTQSGFEVIANVSANASMVEFFVNSMRVDVDNIPPYSTKLSGLAKGNYTIFARVHDSKNEHTTSAPIIVTVSGIAEKY